MKVQNFNVSDEFYVTTIFWGTKVPVLSKYLLTMEDYGEKTLRSQNGMIFTSVVPC
jgi:hypothetical protein